MKCSRKQLGLAIVLAQSVAIPAAYAQLEEIVVTAERREASLQETDIAITAFSETTIQEMGINNFLDISGFAPNVLMHDMPGKAGGAIAIRGFKNAETIATFEPKVALYQDGVIIAKNAGSLMDVLDLERVEVLRGPQGTLYGRNTVGGAVNLITKKPDAENFSGKIMATLGDFGQRDLKGNINLPLIEGQLALKASLASLNRDGYWTNTVNGEDLGEKDREAALVQLQWQPSDNLSILYAYDRSRVDDGMMPIILVNASRPDLLPYVTDGSADTRSLDNTDEFMKAAVDGHAVTVNWDVSEDLSLVSITSFRDMEVSNSQDSDGTPVFVLHNASGDKVETFTQEIRLVGSSMDDRLEYVAGAFYMDEDIKETSSAPRIGIGLPWEAALASGFYFLSANNSVAVNENYAIFGEATYAVTDQLDFTAGLRYTEEDRTLKRTSESGVVAFGTTVAELPLGEGTFDDVSGTLSLSYNWNDDAMTYVKVSKGYASGGFNARADNADPETFLRGYDEEEVFMYELGWKTQWLDNRLQVNGAIFRNDYKSIQLNQLTDSGNNNITNAGDATIDGLELEILASITDNMEIGLNFGYLDPEYDTYLDAGGKDLSTQHFAHAPDNTISGYARYVVPSFQDIGDLIFRVDFQDVDDHWALVANDPDAVDRNFMPSYTTFNGRISLDGIEGPNGSTVNVALWGKNLNDETWWTSGFDLTAGSLGFSGRAVAPPRTFGVDLTVEF